MITEIVFQNPQASQKLIYNLVAECNTPDEKILSNVLENSRRVSKWLKTEPENDKTLVLCGSGPSIKEDVATIAEMQRNGAVVWALNNCANFLAMSGVIADVQVIMDARPETINAIGPAKAHYFASQVDPSLFDAKPNAVLWHSTHGDILVDEQNGFPSHDDDYCLIGSSISVGNTAMILAYTQGFRDLHLFGYDSSNKGTSHVVHQPWNDGEPMTIVEFRGKEYECSVTMKLQAESFFDRAKALQNVGCKISVHGYGLIPDKWNAEFTEQEKYEEMWRNPDYRAVSPGQMAASTFLSVLMPEYGSTVGDFGCGTGRGGLDIYRSSLCDVTLFDFTSNSRDEEAKHLPFIQCDLTKKINSFVDYGFCCDVMEHIPTDDVDSVINNIMSACWECFFQISTVPDTMGAHIGKDLHLTVKPHSWWREKFASLGYAVRWEEEGAAVASFHISSTGDNQ